MTLIPATPLTDKQRLAIDLIGAGVSMAEIANRLDMRLETLWQWRYEEAFALELRKRNEALQAWAHDAHMGLVPKAIETVKALLDSDNDKVKLAAAKMILDRALETKEDTEEDLKKLRLVFARELLRYLARIPTNELGPTVKALTAQAEEM